MNFKFQISSFLAATLIVFSAFSFLFVQPAAAQESLTLEVSPPLFQIKIVPGGEWNSQLKVVNPNPYNITVAPRVADYEPFEDRPGGELLTRRETPGAERFSASFWTDIASEPVVVPAEDSVTIPVALSLPDDAEPGTHTAAVVVGNIAETGEESGSAISTSVTSLLVVNVLGEAQARGNIVYFSSGEYTYPTTSADFVLEFENKGDVHLEPKGEVVISNIWGVERGRVPVALNEDLRLVLPNERKEFRFVWEGESGFFEIGPYKAVANLTYGGENQSGERQALEAETWFWVVPWTQIAVVGLGLLLFALLIVFGIRSVIRRIFLREAMARRVQPFGSLPPKAVDSMRRESVVDLRNQKPGTDDGVKGMDPGIRSKGQPATPVLKVGMGLAAIFAVGIAVLYIMSAASRNTTYTVGLPEEDGLRIVGEDELFELTQPKPQSGSEILAEPAEEEAEVAIEVRVLVQNGSGIAGKAAEVSARLRDAGFTTVTSENADSFNYSRTVIRYRPGRGALVEELRDILGVDPVIEERNNLPEEIVVIVGQDL